MKYKLAYEERYSEPVSTFGGHASDALGIIVLGLERGKTNRTLIRDYIESTKRYVGVSGVFNFSPTAHNGLTKESFALIKIKNKKFTLLKK